MRNLSALVMSLLITLLIAAPAWAASNALTWTNPSPDNAVSIEVWRKIEACAGPSVFALLASVLAPATAYTDPGLTEGVTYCYEVRGVNPAGASAFSNTASRTVPFTVPAARSGLGVGGGP